MDLQQMQSQANHFLYTMGAQTVFVYAQPTTETIAATLGITIHENLLGFSSPISGGIIKINEKELIRYTDSEINFIIAHECAHIFKSHAVATLFWNLIEQAAKGEQNENYAAVEFIKVLLALSSKNNLPPNAVTLRNQEYEADLIAAQTTGDYISALSCLTKLCGNNLNEPSHTWELFEDIVPAMTMGERIDTLKSNLGIT